MKTRRLALIAMVFASSVAIAGPKTPAPTTFHPEIAYSYATRNGPEVRISNREGTAAKVLYRGHFSALDMAPRSGQMVAFLAQDPTVQDNRFLHLQGWIVDSAGNIVLTPLRTLAQGKISHIDFSPDGSSIAFTSKNGIAGHEDIWIADVATGAVRQVGTEKLQELTWSGDGKFLYYRYHTYINGVHKSTLYRLSVGGGAPVALASEIGINGIDTARRTAATGEGDTGLILSVKREETGESLRIGSWDGSSVDQLGRPALAFFNLRGKDAHYSCNNGSIIYKEETRNNYQNTKIYDVATGVSSTFSTDIYVSQLDWNNCP